MHSPAEIAPAPVRPADGRRIGRPDWEDGDDDQLDNQLLDGGTLTLGTLGGSAQFVYVFDLGDCWTHLCTVGEHRIDPQTQLGIIPDRPLPYWGSGPIPDQYGRRFDRHDGDTPLPADPKVADLPTQQPAWGAAPTGQRTPRG